MQMLIRSGFCGGLRVCGIWLIATLFGLMVHVAVAAPFGLYADDDISLTLSASDAIALPSAEHAAPSTMKLQVTVRLRNHKKRVVDLQAPNRCAVFRWAVWADQKRVQAKPNRMCSQVIAWDELGATKQLERSYELLLDPQRYTRGQRYRLLYSFWGYSGHYDFTVK